MKVPIVSVVIATHNRASLLPFSVDSILRQSMSDFELIIVDDGSRDETPLVMKDLQSTNSCIKGLRTEISVGPGAARNLGIFSGRGKYVAIMDDDDTSEPNRLDLQSRILDNNPSTGMVFSPVAWVDDKDEVFNIFPGIVHRGKFPEDPKSVFELLYLEGNKIPNPTIMVRREIFERLGGYPPHPWIWPAEDWFLFMQMAAMGIKMIGTRDVLVNMRRGRDHITLMSNKAKAFSANRRILSMTRSWLRANDIHEFDHLHFRALSNEIVREARYWQGIKGLVLCHMGLFLNPTNCFARESLVWLYGKGWHKVKRALF